MNLTVLFQVWVVVFFVFFTHLRHHVITSHKALWVKKGRTLFTMATETLQFVVNRHKVPVTLFILMYIDVLRCQPFTIPFRTPSDCGAEEFFDISSLSCVRCGPNQRRSTTGRLTSPSSHRITGIEQTTPL